MKKLLDYIKTILLLCSVTVVSAIVVMKIVMYTGGESVAVPDLRDRTIINTLEALDERGLYLKVTRMDFSTTTPKNKVISQDPKPGSVLKKGREVKVIVSRGSQDVLVPDLVGSSIHRADIILGKSDLRIRGKIFVTTSNHPRNAILAQKPPKNAKVRRGDSVNLLVSSGPHIEYLMIPNFINSTLSEAMVTIKNMDIKVGRVAYRPDDINDRGVVMEQTPSFGSRVAHGSFVSLTVSEGRLTEGEEAATFTFFYYTVPEGTSAYKVSVVQENLDGEKDVYNRVHRPTDTISLLLEVKGSTAAKIFLNGQLVEVKRF